MTTVYDSKKEYSLSVHYSEFSTNLEDKKKKKQARKWHTSPGRDAISAHSSVFKQIRKEVLQYILY